MVSENPDMIPDGHDGHGLPSGGAGFHICMAHMEPAIHAAERMLQAETDVAICHLISLRADSHPDDKRMSIISMECLGRAGSSTNLRMFSIGVVLFGEEQVIDISCQETEGLKTVVPWTGSDLPMPKAPPPPNIPPPPSTGWQDPTRN